MSDPVDRLAAPGPPAEAWSGTATVANAATGTTTDGRKLITVTWQGTNIDCNYLASYTPVLGDNVIFLKAGASFLVLGKPAI